MRIAQRDRLDRLVQTNPLAALAEARRWRDANPDEMAIDAEASAVIGRALFEQGELSQAVAVMQRALRAAERVADEAVLFPIAMSAAAVFAVAGHLADALKALDELDGLLGGTDDDRYGRLETQRSYVLYQSGALADALACSDRAEPVLRASKDDLGLMRLVLHRGVLQLQRGELAAAETDFLAADQMADALGQTATRGIIAGNLGVLHGRARRITDSLAQFDRARVLYERSGSPGRSVAITEIDRAEVLMHAGLTLDAVDAARAAVRLVEPTGNHVDLGDAQLLLARTHLAAGGARDAERAADEAARAFLAADRQRMIPLAVNVAIQAALGRANDPTAHSEALRRAASVIDDLVRFGWDQVADELRLARVRSGYRSGCVDEVADDLERLRLGTFHGQRDIALAGWYAEAISRAVIDDAEGALEACRTGLDLLDEIVDEAPSLERRSATINLGKDLSRLTIALAIAARQPETVLAAAEGTRARSLHYELMQRHSHRPLTTAGAAQLRRELSTRLGDRVLVEFVVGDDSIWAVVFDMNGARLVPLASSAEVLRARDRLVMSLDHAAIERDSSETRGARAARDLADLVIEPLDLPERNELVIVPVGVLHGVAWSALPGVSHRHFSIAPSARIWLEADRRATGAGGSVGLVVGPDVEYADVERADVEAVYPHLTVASGQGATASTVRSMFTGLDVVHIAAHGRFRPDHPLLSTLRLSDGDGSLYDTVPERIGARLVVLSSCEGGAQGSSDGSEVLGLASVLLARGAAAVIAPLTVVGDRECAAFVGDVHREWASGASVAGAIAKSRVAWLASGDASRWAVAASFVCFGSGGVTMS